MASFGGSGVLEKKFLCLPSSVPAGAFPSWSQSALKRLSLKDQSFHSNV